MCVCVSVPDEKKLRSEMRGLCDLGLIEIFDFSDGFIWIILEPLSKLVVEAEFP